VPQTYAQIVTNAADSTWKARVRAAMVEAAIAISVDAPNSVLDTRRDRLARNVLTNPDEWTDRFSLAVALGFLADTDLSAGNVTDAEIATRVSAVWNDFLNT
jgi:hypothetical protein